MSRANTSLTFKIYKHGAFLREETIAGSVIKVGKLSSSHLRLEDESVSRMHAVIEVADNELRIIDLGSTVGTWINGRKVNKATLQDGDSIAIGDLRLELAVAMPAAAEASTVPAAALEPAIAPPAILAAAPPLIPSAPPTEIAPGSSAIEVKAMLGDSIVGVKHVMNPRGGKTSGATYGLFAAGALLLIMSAVAFFSGVGIAADNKARYHEHLASNNVAHEFRPQRLGVVFDWMAVGGLLGGMLCVTMGLLRVREERIEPHYRIGRAPGVDFPTEESPLEDFALVAPRGDDFVCNFASEWQGELVSDGQVSTLAELSRQGQAPASRSVPGAREVLIPPNAQIHLRTGAQSFALRAVVRPRRQPTPLLSSGGSELAAYLAASAILVLGFVFLLDTLHAEEKTLYGDMFADGTRIAQLQAAAKEDPIEEKQETQTGSDEASGGTGTKMAGADGKMGTEKSTRATGRFAIENRNTPPALAREVAVQRAREAGVLGLLAQRRGGSFAAITGTADFSSGLDDRDIYGGLLGAETGEMAGGWGYGVDGLGPGAGGEGWGTVGTGSYGLIGHSEGTGTGYAPGSGKGDMRVHKAAPPKVDIGPANTDGDLDAEIIRRHIRRKLARIRHCYEKELLASADLRGTVVTRFQISPAGKVQGVKASGMGNEKVESCVAAAIQSIQFPKPKNGGYVNVRRYPFTFQPAGG